MTSLATQQQALATHTPSATPFGDALSPRTHEQAMAWCQAVAKESWVPQCYRGQPMLVAIAVSFGERFGMDPMACLQNIAVINGKPCMYGDMMLAVSRQDPAFEDYQEDYTDRPVGCTVTVKRRGQSPIVETFGENDAKKAGLWGRKGPWESYPKRMCMWRARGFALRTAFPDRFMGIISREEAMDYPTVDQHGRPAQQVRGRVMDASSNQQAADAGLPSAPPASGGPESLPDASEEQMKATQSKLVSAESWGQLAEAVSAARELKQSHAVSQENNDAWRQHYMASQSRLSQQWRALLDRVEQEADWVGMEADYALAPKSVQDDLLPRYNAAAARVSAAAHAEDEGWDNKKDDDIPW